MTEPQIIKVLVPSDPVISIVPSQTVLIKVTSPGPQGPPGRPGDGSEPDVPDLTLLFENGLV